MKFLERQFEEIGYAVDDGNKNNYSLRKFGTNDKQSLSKQELDKKLAEIRNKLVIDEIVNRGGF